MKHCRLIQRSRAAVVANLPSVSFVVDDRCGAEQGFPVGGAAYHGTAAWLAADAQASAAPPKITAIFGKY